MINIFNVSKLSEMRLLEKWSKCIDWCKRDKSSFWNISTNINWKNPGKALRVKKRAYNEEIMNVEQGTFTSLVLNGSGKWDVSRISILQNCHKKEDENSKVANYIRCKVALIVLRSVLLCFRGSSTLRKVKIVTVAEDIDLGHGCVELLL